MEAWHALDPTSVLARLDSSAAGLSHEAAATRLAEVGPNAIPRAARASAWSVLLAQLRSIVVVLLVVATLVAGLTSDAVDAVAIGAVLVLNVAIGFTMEMRSRRAVEALAGLETPLATVIRDGMPEEIDARGLVPGDVIAIEAGQSVPADARVIAGELRISEATLTGESVPVSKTADRVLPADTALPDRSTMVHAGSTALDGAAHAVVVATGGATELGTIGRLVAGTAVEQTTLERQLDGLGRQLVWVALAVALATGVLGWRQHVPPADLLQAAIALAVAAVPEGLPVVATIALALAVRRMAQRHALVRRLPAAESLGSVTVLCTDKTGTLTSGTMAVTQVRTLRGSYDVTGTSYEPIGDFRVHGRIVAPSECADLWQVLRVAVLAGHGDAVLTSEGWAARGDPTESAIATAARKAGIERAMLTVAAPEVGDVPFSSDRRFMATFHRTSADGALVACVKGAPTRVLRFCTAIQDGDVVRALDVETRARVEAENHLMAGAGLRVLAVALGRVPRGEESALRDLTFAGLVGIADPPAAGVADSIAAFRRAGIRTVMITGDQRGTAAAVAAQLGLGDGTTVVEGGRLEAMADDALMSLLSTATVFSRVSPAAKLRLVAAYQSMGEVVAMIGDGVNDAAALRKADVGVTMGRRGTDVARETAAVVLEDDRFSTIAVAIAEGRVVFDNIRRFVFYLFSCNLAEVLVLLGTSAAGLPLPLAPIQVLWLNLVTDTVPALALAFEPGGDDVMRRPPRPPQGAILSWPLLRGIGGYAALIAGAAFVVIAWAASAGIERRTAMTMAFMVLGLAQIFHLGNARDDRPVLRPSRAIANRHAVAALLIGVVSLAGIQFVPSMAALLDVDVLPLRLWGLVLAASAVPALVGQAAKALRRSGRRAAAVVTGVLLSAGAATAAPADAIVGGVREVVVVRGDTLRSTGARLGVDAATLAADNRMAAGERLAIGRTLRVDNRHIIPASAREGVLVINVPQRMLFYALPDQVLAFPVAAGRRTWPTPLGPFSVISKEVDPTWEVPRSIQEEAQRAGTPLPAIVPPGPDNPLGRHWLGLSLGGVGLHGTNAPASIYGLVSHGCVRLHPDDIATLFDTVRVGTMGEFVYEPILLAASGDDILLEAHPDVYRRGPADREAYVRRLAEARGLTARIDWPRVAAVLRERAGVARVVTFGVREFTGS